SGARRPSVVAPPDGGELPVGERLDTERDPVDARLFPGGDGYSSDVVRVRLQGHLRPGQQAKMPRERGMQPREVRKRDPRGRSPAEINGVECRALRLSGDESRLLLESGEIRVARRVVRRNDERAVLTPRDAIRQMDVDAGAGPDGRRRAGPAPPGHASASRSAASASRASSGPRGKAFPKLPSRRTAARSRPQTSIQRTAA